MLPTIKSVRKQVSRDLQGGIIILPIQYDRKNMTEKCVHDRKDHNDEH